MFLVKHFSYMLTLLLLTLNGYSLSWEYTIIPSTNLIEKISMLQLHDRCFK